MILKGKKYFIGGTNLLSLADEFGTPLYIYDSEKIITQYRKFVSAFRGIKCRIKYACKANSNLSILKLLNRLGAGLDAVSLEEAKLGLRAGYEPNEILFTPNSVAFDEYEKAVSEGFVINIDNIGILEQFGHKFGKKIPCCIRINPHVAAGGHSYIQTGHIDSKFGISIHQIQHIERIVKIHQLKIAGLHMHTGSDILDGETFITAAEILFQSAKHFPDLSFLNFGSGFKVKYRSDDAETDIRSVGKTMSKRFQAFCKTYGKELELWFEPGKFLVSEAGSLLVKVNVIKQTPSTLFAGVNSGLNHLIRPMFYDAYHEIVNASNPTGTQRVYSVVGYICETDTFARDRKLNEVREGDILCIRNAGAYGYSMSSNYNSRLRPAEILVSGGKVKLIRKRESIEDLLRCQIE